MDHIRNFCIIAHIDHGKSTLADRLIQRCGAVEDREFRDQILDSMDLERERGITIKANTVTLPYTARDGKTYELNLIDTPGHVDFSHEVRRSLMSCEGALLVVDASQGVEAQTVANLYLAMEFGLHGGAGDQQDRPAVRRRGPGDGGDRPRPRARPVRLDPGLGQDGHGHRRPAGGDRHASFLRPRATRRLRCKALLFDAQYDSYRGAVLLVRLFDGTLKAPTRVRLMHSDAEHKVEEVGNQTPQAGAGARAVGGGGRLRARGHEEPRGSGHRRHAHGGRPARRGAGSRLSRGEARRVLVDLPDVHRRLRGPDEGAREAEAQRRVPHLREGQPRPPWASASAAGSWGCSTSTWCRRGSSASTTCR